MTDTHNIYTAPESELSPTGDFAELAHFTRFSTWAVLGLSIITFGIYSVYWLVTRSNVINSFHENKIPSGYIWGYVAVYGVSTLVSIGTLLIHSELLSQVDFAMTIVYFVMYLIVTFTIRSRLKVILGTPINGVITFFFSHIYFQYKINSMKDAAATFD